jgi:hypothetical protein
MYIYIISVLVQFSLLLTVGFQPLPLSVFVLLILLVITSVACVIYARLIIQKSRLSARRNIILRNGICTPDDEADEVPDQAVYLLGVGSILLGISFALFTAVLAGSDVLSSVGFFTQDTLLQTLRFASITLLALHRVLRPANRIDPMRTILELEVVAVCWDAIDGSTLYELLDSSQRYSATLTNAIRFLMAFWYLSVGVRMSIMLCTQLSPQAWGNRLLLTAPLQLAPQPTVDRTLQGLRLRAIVIMTMACADFYAAALRIYMWSHGLLDALQQDMAVKNIIFLITFSGAYSMFTNTIDRDWNARELLTSPIVLKYPSREKQMLYLRYGFVASYLTIGALLSSILISTQAGQGGLGYIANILVDAILCGVFLVYARWVHKKAVSNA